MLPRLSKYRKTVNSRQVLTEDGEILVVNATGGDTYVNDGQGRGIGLIPSVITPVLSKRKPHKVTAQIRRRRWQEIASTGGAGSIFRGGITWHNNTFYVGRSTLSPPNAFREVANEWVAIDSIPNAILSLASFKGELYAGCAYSTAVKIYMLDSETSWIAKYTPPSNVYQIMTFLDDDTTLYAGTFCDDLPYYVLQSTGGSWSVHSSITSPEILDRGYEIDYNRFWMYGMCSADGVLYVSGTWSTGVGSTPDTYTDEILAYYSGAWHLERTGGTDGNVRRMFTVYNQSSGEYDIYAIIDWQIFKRNNSTKTWSLFFTHTTSILDYKYFQGVHWICDFTKIYILDLDTPKFREIFDTEKFGQILNTFGASPLRLLCAGVADIYEYKL